MASFQIRQEKVSSLFIKDRHVDIYDSSLEYQKTENFYGDIVKTVSTLHIPSSRYYYLNRTGYRIPYLALSPPDQFTRDLSAWKNKLKTSPIIYASSLFEPSNDPEINLTSIANGEIPTIFSNRLAEELLHYLYVTNLERGEENFLLQPKLQHFKLMFYYPFNPSADFIKASQLAANRDADGITKYLDERDIITFNVNDIIKLGKWSIFFYLTRFYGPPIEGDLETNVLIRIYTKQSNNNLTKRLSRSISRQPYNKYTNEFNAIFQHFNENPDSDYYLQLGALSVERFKNSFWNYLDLLGRPKNLPSLTLSTIRSLQPIDLTDLVDFLLNFTDQEIKNLVGDFTLPRGTDTRIGFVHRASYILLNPRTFLLIPTESSLCKNLETIALDEFSDLTHAFVGRGVLADGFDCYDIPELFDYFEALKDADGTYVFRDPLHTSANFSVKDLEDLRNAVGSGRHGIPADKGVVDRFQKYIDQAILQENVGFAKIRKFRAFKSESPENNQLLKDLIMSYFHMGMYMRQWEGPGNPYPLLQSQTGSTVHGLGRAPGWIDENIYKERTERFEMLLAKLSPDLQEDFGNLHTYYYDESTGPISVGVAINKRYKEVIVKGYFCIRMASGPWAYTGAYYYKQIFGEDIPGLDLSRGIDFIH